MQATHTPHAACAGEDHPRPRPIGPRNPAGVRYYEPSTHQSWTGRGPMPDWIKARLRAGHALADFEARPYTNAAAEGAEA